MKIKYNAKEIKDFESWEQEYKSTTNKKWKGSALHLASHFTKDNNKEETINRSLGITLIHDLLNQIGFSEITFQSAEAEIEHKSKFDDYRRPRQHDLYISVKDRNNTPSIAVCIEAKVKEPFGRSNLATTYTSAPHNSKLPNRIDQLCVRFFGCNFNDLKKETKLIRYQLLHYLAGAVEDGAKNNNQVLMLVLAYNTDSNSNHKAYLDFVKAVGFDEYKTYIGSAIYMQELKSVNNQCVKVYTCYLNIKI
jgi:hypothetical protein